MLNKQILFAALTSCILLFTSFTVSNEKKDAPLQTRRLKTVVIDAGHGGKDAGAKGAYSHEKDLTLQIALKLEQTMREAMPDVNIVMTRTTDVYDAPPVKANKANAAVDNTGENLFISIHCDASPAIKHSEITGYKTQTYYTGKGKSRKKRTRKVPIYHTWYTPSPAEGASTYIWAVHKNDDKELAMRENESLYIDSTLAGQFEGFDPDSPEKRILYTLKTQQFFERSARLALTVEEEFENIGRAVRGALQRQIGIWVLQAVAMPSILVETGYITNAKEEAYLNSDAGQQETADVITKAVIRYRNSIENPQ